MHCTRTYLLADKNQFFFLLGEEIPPLALGRALQWFKSCRCHERCCVVFVLSIMDYIQQQLTATLSENEATRVAGWSPLCESFLLLTFSFVSLDSCQVSSFTPRLPPFCRVFLSYTS